MPNFSFEEAEAWLRKTVSAWGDDGDHSAHHHRVQAGAWEIARLKVYEEGDGALRAESWAVSFDGTVAWGPVASAKTERGEASADLESFIKSLRSLEPEIPALIPRLLERSCQEAMALGMTAEAVVEAANRAVVRSVMES